jgi:hypothetical protein
MSIYERLLRSALEQSQSHESSTSGDALAQLLERRRSAGNCSSYSGPDRAPAAIADQLAYDVALIELSLRLGLEVDLTKFDQPRQERRRLEQALISRGVDLDEFEHSKAVP